MVIQGFSIMLRCKYFKESAPQNPYLCGLYSKVKPIGMVACPDPNLSANNFTDN